MSFILIERTTPRNHATNDPDEDLGYRHDDKKQASAKQPFRIETRKEYAQGHNRKHQ